MDTLEHDIDQALDRAIVKGEEAALRIKSGSHWIDWVEVGEALVTGRLLAMRKSGTNQPVGHTYNKAFGDFLKSHKLLEELDKATRNHAMWAADNRNAIERWRETLATNVRSKLNHPTTVRRAFEAATRLPSGEIKEKGPTTVEKLQAEVVRLDEENALLRKRAADGSLFDLKKDAVEDIAGAICDSLMGTPSRLQRLVTALNNELKALKAQQKHAG